MVSESVWSRYGLLLVAEEGDDGKEEDIQEGEDNKDRIDCKYSDPEILPSNRRPDEVVDHTGESNG